LQHCEGRIVCLNFAQLLIVGSPSYSYVVINIVYISLFSTPPEEFGVIFQVNVVRVVVVRVVVSVVINVIYILLVDVVVLRHREESPQGEEHIICVKKRTHVKKMVNGTILTPRRKSSNAGIPVRGGQ
jgi:hypothetical protein